MPILLLAVSNISNFPQLPGTLVETIVLTIADDLWASGVICTTGIVTLDFERL